MGYTYDGSIKNYWPDNTETTLYLHGEYTFNDILERAKEHFGEKFDLKKINIRSEHIHVFCLTYDLYDPSDYVNFIVIELEE